MKDQKELLEYLIKTAKDNMKIVKDNTMWDRGARAAYEARIITYNELLSKLK